MLGLKLSTVFSPARQEMVALFSASAEVIILMSDYYRHDDTGVLRYYEDNESGTTIQDLNNILASLRDVKCMVSYSL